MENGRIRVKVSRTALQLLCRGFYGVLYCDMESMVTVGARQRVMIFLFYHFLVN